MRLHPPSHNAAPVTSEPVNGYDDDEPKFEYAARYYMQEGCTSPLSYTLDADVAFPIKKGGFTSVRIRIPDTNTVPKKRRIN